MARAYWRLIKAFLKFLPLALAYARDRNRWLLFGRSREMTSERKRRRARRLTDALLALGPTYIKFGQVLSTRPDIVPQEYIDELIELQDDVPPAPYDEVERIIEEDIGHPDEVFDTFERDALSGASLGQVHIAYYRGNKVAVKVRRPRGRGTRRRRPPRHKLSSAYRPEARTRRGRGGTRRLDGGTRRGLRAPYQTGDGLRARETDARRDTRQL